MTYSVRTADLSPCLNALAENIGKIAADHPKLFGTVAQKALERLNAPYTHISTLLASVTNANRVMAIHHAGLAGDEDFKLAVDDAALPAWTDTPPMEADIPLQHAMGLKLLNLVRDGAGAEVHLSVGPGSDHIVGAMVEDLYNRSIPFHIVPYDADFSRLLIAHASAEGIIAYAAYRVALLKDVTNDIVAMPNSLPPARVTGSAEKAALFAQHMAPYREKTRSGAVPFTLTYFPTETDAALDGIPLPDYLKLYFDMSDQPDHLIGAAHEHLIARLNKTEHVRFTNNDGTDVSMSLIDNDGRHFTFCNSLTYRNIPGSEVFSAPRRDSVNGVIVAKGKFSAKGGKGDIITDLTMRFENGRIVDFSAADGAEHFQAFLDRDPGNFYVGELGIGTNPHLKRHVLNGLFVEKVGGSFHLALGAAYTMTDYLGTPVHVDNGNKSADHWDVTTMLYGRGGCLYLDGDIAIKDGMFVDPALDILNRGWAAVPVTERPERWKNYKGPFTEKGESA